MRSDAERVAKYNAKVTPTTVGLKIAAQLPQMVPSFATITQQLAAKQQETADILNATGLVGSVRGRYHAYGNRLFAICRKFNGATATNMAQIEHDKFESVCMDATLISIALNVYGLVVT